MRAVSLTAVLCLTLALGMFCVSCGGSAAKPTVTGNANWSDQLPNLSELEGLTGNSVVRSSSDATLDLLASEPFSMSGPNDEEQPSVTYNPGYLYLDSSVKSPSWAMFRISGLGTDGETYPVSVSFNNSAVCWIGVSNYERGCWDFQQVFWPGSVPVAGEDGLVNDAGSSYVLVLADTTIPDIYALSVTLNNTPAGAPTAQINLQGMAVTEWETSFNAVGSDKGNGEFTEFVYEFDGGSPHTVTEPDAVVGFMFTTTGTHTVRLTVRNDLGLQHTILENIEVGDPNRDLLVIYNSDIPEDIDLVEYYMSPLTGRGIDPQHKLGLALGTYSATISRENYISLIRDPIRQFIGDYPTIGGKVKYLLLMNGMPHKIPGTDGSVHDLSTYSSVDSELCLLNSGGAIGDGGYKLEGAVWSESAYHAWNGNGFYLAGDVDFVPSTFTVTDLDGAHWPLDYLVGRLSAYTYENAKQLVDRSLAAQGVGSAWVILDSKPSSNSLDTMVDPVWPLSDDSWDSGVELLAAAGLNVVGDVTSDRLTSTWDGYPVGFENSLAGYCSWGKHSGFEAVYILQYLGFNYIPGACFMSYESFNGTTLRCTDPSEPATSHPSQGQIADFLYMGGTVAIGNVYEPWTDGVGDERWVFDRYLHHGDRWIEAAYKGLPMLSWQEIVVGDPLCQMQ